MLKIENLCVSYGGIKALRGISLEVPDGKIVTLIGANGAGKSTTLRTISGLVKADSGSITYDGQELLGKPINKILEAGIAQSPEGRRVFANLTVLENLKAGAYLRKDKDGIEKDIKWVYELFPRLEERNWQLAGTLSGGEQQMLAVGRALMSRPKLLMLDEPSLGLAPLVVQGIFDIIRTVNEQGVTVLLIEHGPEDRGLRLCAGDGQHHQVRHRRGAAGGRVHQGSLPGQKEELNKHPPAVRPGDVHFADCLSCVKLL